MYTIDYKTNDFESVKQRLQVVEEYAYHMDKILQYIIKDMENETGHTIPQFLYEQIIKLQYTTIH